MIEYRKYLQSMVAAAACALVWLVANPALAGEMPQLVDCTLTEPQSIQDVLAGVDPDPGETLIITVRGLCTEDVVIVSNDIKLQGETPSDGISGGGITVRGAQRVVIDNLTVTNSPGIGVLAENGAAVTVSNSNITGNTGFGIHVILGATAQINGNEISDNGNFAIIVTEQGSARLRSNTITTDFVGGALGAYRNASLRLNGGNTVTNTNGAGNALGIEAFHVSNIRQGPVGDRGPDELTANRVVSAGNLSTVDLRDFVATGNANVSAQSSLRLRNGTFDGDIVVSAFGVADKRSTVSGTNSCTSDGGVCSGF